MSVSFELVANVRQELGRVNSRRLRRTGLVPAIIYGAGKAPVAISLLTNDLSKALEHEAFYSHILTLNVGGTKEKVVLKAIDRHPSQPVIRHLDFLRVKATEALTMRVPLHFAGAEEAKGVKDQGGVISHALTDVEVKCLPADLPEFIKVDVSQLELNDTVHLSDLKLPKGVELIELSHGEGHDPLVVAIYPPKKIEEEVVTPAEGEEAEAETEAEKGAVPEEETPKEGE